MTKVLITGMSGLIGGILRNHLTDLGGYSLRALNRRPVAGVETCVADISDLESIKSAFDGIDVVVHLAAYVDMHQGIGTFDEHLKTNIIGTYNVFEAARLAGVKRVVFASSGATIMGFERESPYKEIAEGLYDQIVGPTSMITHEMTRPSGLYGASKVWGESLARHFVDTYGLSIICVRIGYVSGIDRPTDTRHMAVYLSHRDLCQALRLAITAPDSMGFAVFFAVSANKWGYRDIQHSKQLLGYVPLDSADDYS
jgi:uronate dehydrogenase